MSADEKQLDKDIVGLWSKINQLTHEKQKSKKEEEEQNILDSGIPFKKIEASELKKGDLISTAYDKFSVVDEVKIMPRTTKVFYSTFYDGYNNDKSLFWTFKNYEEIRIVDLKNGQLIAQISSKGGADVTDIYYEVNKHGAYASIKGEGRSGTSNFNKKDIDSGLGYNWREYQPKVNIDVLGILGKVKTADDLDSELFEKRLSKRYSDVNKLVEDYKVFDTEKGDKFSSYDGLMRDALVLMNAGSGTPRVVYKELGLNDFINKRAALKTIKQFDKFLDEAIILLENAIVTSLSRVDDSGISLMGDKYDEFIKKYPKSISTKKEPIAIEVEKEENLSEQLTKEIEALNEYLEDAKEEGSKELISELEDRIEFLEELKEEAEENNPIKKNKGGKSDSTIGESRLMNLPEYSVIELNNHLIGLSLQISELIQARIEYLQKMSDEDYSKLKAGVYDFKQKVTDTQSYEEWLKESKEIDKESDDASDAIKSFPRNEMGLTPDNVKNTEEYKVANKNWNTSWKKLQEFNRTSPNEFKRRASNERRQAMMLKNKG